MAAAAAAVDGSQLTFYKHEHSIISNNQKKEQFQKYLRESLKDKVEDQDHKHDSSKKIEMPEDEQLIEKIDILRKKYSEEFPYTIDRDEKE